MSTSEQEKSGFELSQRRLAIETQQASLLLRPLRLRAGLSQRELARRACVASNTVANAERGHVPLRPTQERIARALAAVLDEPVDGDQLWPPIEGTAAA
jgi:transcriptional regulator with XRE-family HTH domain